MSPADMRQAGEASGQTARVSVIVPCYNAEDTLERCLDSLKAQTIPLEIVIVDDGSTDGTAAIAARYARGDDAIRVVTQENRSLPQARRSGLAAASGDCIGFLDADDWAEPDMFERLLDLIRREDADIACCGYTLDGERGVIRRRGMIPPDGVLGPEEALRGVHRLQCVLPVVWNKLYRREVFRDVVFPEGNFIGEDYATTVQLIANARRIAVTDAPLVHYWQGKSGMSRAGFCETHVRTYEYFREMEPRMIRRYPEQAADIRCFAMVEYMCIVLAMDRNGRYDREMMRWIQRYVRRHLPDILLCPGFPSKFRIAALLMAVHGRLMLAARRITG